MSASRLVGEVAKALIQAALSAENVPKIVADVKAVSRMFSEEPSMLAALREPAVPLNDRTRALRSGLDKNVHPFAANAFLSLQFADALDEHVSFSETVVAYAREHASHHELEIMSAVPLKPEERKKLEQALAKRYQGTRTIEERVEPELLGGLIVKTGAEVIDASVKGKINRLRSTLSV